MTNLALTPLLVIRGAIDALDFYARAFGALVLVRHDNPATGTLSHADLALDGARFSLTEEAPGWNSDAPPSLGGSPVVLQLFVDDAGAAHERACAAGAEVVFPLQEFRGTWMSRVRDPFGHLWLLHQRSEAREAHRPSPADGPLSTGRP